MTNSPIFVIGAARSGTKFLRDCLGVDDRVATVPFDVNYVWRYGQSAASHDGLSPDTLDDGKVRFIHKAMAKQAGVKPNDLGGAKILLEKTVSNSLRVPFVEATYPGSRFVHLIRDGRDVATSAMRQWTARPDYGRLVEKLRRMPFGSVPYLIWFARNSVRRRTDDDRVKVWGPRYEGIAADVQSRSLAEVCAIQWQRSVESSLDGLIQIPSDRVHTIRYEELVADDGAIVRLAKALELDANSIASRWQSTVSPGFRHSETDEQRAALAEIEALAGETLRALGY